MFSPSQEELCALNKEPVKYGELVVLGYNGSLPNGDRGRRKSRFALYKRPKANGVKPSTVHVISTPQASKQQQMPITGTSGSSLKAQHCQLALLFSSLSSSAQCEL